MDQTIPLPDGNGGIAHLAGDGQIFGFTLPIIVFHVSTAYGILRKRVFRWERVIILIDSRTDGHSCWYIWFVGGSWDLSLP